MDKSFHIYIEDNKNKVHCSVNACKRIRKRAKKLKISTDKPITVFTECKKTKKKTCYIDDMHISLLLQEAVRKVYNIKCKK